jgi:hypothetical protein
MFAKTPLSPPPVALQYTSVINVTRSRRNRPSCVASRGSLGGERMTPRVAAILLAFDGFVSLLFNATSTASCGST